MVRKTSQRRGKRRHFAPDWRLAFAQCRGGTDALLSSALQAHADAGSAARRQDVEESQQHAAVKAFSHSLLAHLRKSLFNVPVKCCCAEPQGEISQPWPASSDLAAA
jgi:hypothetical protein